MTKKQSRPGAAHTEATDQMPNTRPQRKRLPKPRRGAGSHDHPRSHDPQPNQPIVWETFLSAPPGSPDWLLFPVLERGQHALLFSETKVGKSLLTLDLVKRAGEGCQVDGALTRPLRTLYLDYENPDEDILLRLHDMAATPEQLATLVYIQFPELPPLDTAQGGSRLVRLVRDYDIDLVVIDTISRALDGPENDSSTAHNFYRHSLLPLKRMGVSSLRLDHSGADASKGARGSTAKNSDVDSVWNLRYDKKRARRTLIRTHTRRGRGPDKVEFDVQTGPLRHLVAVTSPGPSSAVADICATLDKLGVPPTAGRPKAQAALQEAGMGRSTELVQQAVKQRQASVAAVSPEPGQSANE